ncbi:MAG: 6-phosphogluconolactonase [Actinomycetota bacterium]|nr:6-phosphogluconolactonase [Actinomycetota bacterium]
MSPRTEVFPKEGFARAAATEIARLLPTSGSVVVTGGGTAEALYPELARAAPDWTSVDVFFSDERCVPPDDPRSNYGMAKRTLLDATSPRSVHRMHGEIDPQDAAAIYDQEVADVLDLVLLGLGGDAHVAGLFPGSPALVEAALCAVVDRPDGLQGLSLTPPALLSGRTVALVVTGEPKAEAVARAIRGNEDVTRCPAALFREHESVLWILDEGAAAAL